MSDRIDRRVQHRRSMLAGVGFGIALFACSPNVVPPPEQQGMTGGEGGGGGAPLAGRAGSPSPPSGGTVGSSPGTGGSPSLGGRSGGSGGASGTATGGSTGTGVGQGGTPDAGGGSAPGPVAGEPCAASRTLSGGQSGNFETLEGICFRTPDEIEGWGCSNFDGRTVNVNGQMVTCGALPLPAKIGGYYYFQATGGMYPWASIYWWGKFVGAGPVPGAGPMDASVSP